MKSHFNYPLFCCLVILFSFAAKAQKKSVASKEYERPKLVVGIVVDQMRYDYISRFWNGYSEGGFKRLVKEGFNFKNNHYNYAPTSTGPGHASVKTDSHKDLSPLAPNLYSSAFSTKKSKASSLISRAI
mgnify:CR=1 FL=1